MVTPPSTRITSFFRSPSSSFYSTWRSRTSATVLSPSRFLGLKHRSNLSIVGVVGFARPWQQLGLNGAALERTIVDARAALCHELAACHRRYGQQLVVASGATNEGVLRLAYEVCSFLNIAAMGIAPDQALDFALGQMRYVVPHGQEFGDESQVFIDCIDELIVLGGGPQSEREVVAFADTGKPITVLHGFGGIADRLTAEQLPTARFVERSVIGRS